MDGDKVERFMHSKKSEDRVRAVSMAEALPEEARLPILVKLLYDKSSYVAALAAKSLGDCADPETLAAMRARFEEVSDEGVRNDPGCHIRANLAFAFGRLEYLPALNSLRRGIRTVQIEAVGGVPFDTGAHLRANCALALAQLSDRESLRDMALLLFDMTSPMKGRDAALAKLEMRKAAAQAIAILGDRSGAVPLTIKLSYPENEMPEVLQECMQALVALEDERVNDILEPYLSSPDAGLSGYAALMLASTASEAALTLLKNAVQTSYGEQLKYLIIAISTHRSDEARDYLISELKSERESVRALVREALSNSLDEVAKAALRQ